MVAAADTTPAPARTGAFVGHALSLAEPVEKCDGRRRTGRSEQLDVVLQEPRFLVREIGPGLGAEVLQVGVAVEVRDHKPLEERAQVRGSVHGDRQA